jgi:hypothetical protein
MKKVSFYHYVVFLLPTFMFLASCGGSGSSSPPASGTTTINGTVFAAPVVGATVVVKDSNGNVLAGPVTTAADGTYSVNIPTSSLAADMRIESNTGKFTDEATVMSTTAGPLAAYVEAGTFTAGSKVNLDPASTIVHKLVTTLGKTVTSAKTAFGNGFGFMPDTSVVPVLSTNPLTGTDGAPRQRGLVAAALSQLTADLGLQPEQQFYLLTALAEDISDGKLNGMNGTSPVTILGTAVVIPTDIQARFCQAVDSASRVALTSTYKVEYLPGMMAAAQGKTTFKIRVTKRSDSSAVPGLTLSLMPMMHMLTMSHATPVDSVIDNGDGTYSCAIYYLMSSVMSGMSMGYWELKVMIGGMMGETTTFYPYVGMSMGTTTVRATLQGQADTVNGMAGPEKRSYYLFNSGLSGTTGFNLFIAAKDTMMSYPAVSDGTILHDTTSTPWTVHPVTVSASTDGTTWVLATDNDEGHWSVSGLSGLSSGVTGAIYVKVNINGENKTTDGNPVSGANGYAAFTVTPQ